jgi:hypothetical protein
MDAPGTAGMTVRLAALTVLLAAPAPAGAADDALDLGREWPCIPAAEADAFRSWYSAAGERARVWTTSSPELARACMTYAEAFQACVCASLEAPLPGPAPVTVVLFANEVEYNHYIAVQLPAGIAVRHGYFDTDHQQSLLMLIPAADGRHGRVPMVTLRHELTHQLVHRWIGGHGIPPWLDEGLACCCSYWEPGDDRATNIAAGIGRAVRGPGSRHLELLSRTVGTPAFIPLSELVAASYADFHLGHRSESQYYCESWALCDFLLTTSRGRAMIAAMLGMLKGGQAIDFATLGLDLAALATAWDGDLRGRMLPQ